MEFKEFPKIFRFSRDIMISEKLDGTNAQIFIRETPPDLPTDTPIVAEVGKLLIYAGSRTTWITPADDNYGFAKWVRANAEDLAMLGPGSHFGEWWGYGVARGYGIKEKRFSLFNVTRWWLPDARPKCCHVVPVLYTGKFTMEAVEESLYNLRAYGSFAAPGFMRPEGVVVFHTASQYLFKKTILKDDAPKSLVAAAG